MKPLERPRRNRRFENLRSALRETHLEASHLVWPVFIQEGEGRKDPISSMPGQFRLSLDQLFPLAQKAQSLGILGLALFPVIEDRLKSRQAEESFNPEGLIPRAVKQLKEKFPQLLVFTDVALDPYSSDGHDGVVEEGVILNDETVHILCRQALMQARAGADYVCPSDMMDGRTAAIRRTLDAEGFSSVGILSYCAKYASKFYGPFREALDSAPRFGDKKTYQMDPGNRREALREARLDQSEGADILMVKPALAYLDVLRDLREQVDLPLAAYQVSGEFTMIKAAGEQGWIDEQAIFMECLLSMRRAGADLIFTYAALEMAELLAE